MMRPNPCPKCGGRTNLSRKHGQDHPWLYCADRKSCGWKSPAAEVAPDAGLGDVKLAPDAAREGLAGLRAV